MKKTKVIHLLALGALIVLITVISSYAQKKYSYISYPNDPLNTRIYTLDNGLKVYISVNKTEPKIATRIAIKAGSKNDPSDATGLAHYLEHMLFKGTDKFGTMDFTTEGKLVNEIIDLYEQNRAETDTEKRKDIYRKIDSISYIASGFAIPNEYDKMLAAIGAQGTNAYTSSEQTVYINEIPANQLSNWLTIESERFRNPVMRLFHTELEVVYEEKNRSLDNGFSKAYENLFAGLFQKHSYGTQTTIGTIEHLKNPSLKKVINYYNTYYVPNNMAMMLSGDIDPDAAIKMIDEDFGSLPKKNVPEFIPPAEDQIGKPIVSEVYSPDSENLFIGFRLPGAGSAELESFDVFSSILFNGTAGLIDLNIVKQQKALNASASMSSMKDYSVYMLSGSPREGQSLESLKELLLSQIELIKKGEFPEWYIKAAVSNYKLNQLKRKQNNNSRVSEYVSSFTRDIPWDTYIAKIDRMSKVTKQDVISAANKYFGENYVVVYKRTGTDKNVQKIVKPQITPVKVNRESESEFLTKIVNAPVEPIKPVFIDFKKEVSEFSVKPGIMLYSKLNEDNDVFSLSLVYDMGSNNDRIAALAMGYIQFLGTSKYSAAELAQEFYKIGCTFGTYRSTEKINLTISGLNENMPRALELLQQLINEPRPDDKALSNLTEDILKSRTNAKLSKSTILNSAMMNFGIYGQNSPFTNIISESELKNLKSQDLINVIKLLAKYKHDIVYFGPYAKSELERQILQHYRTKDLPLPLPPAKEFTELPTEENKIYFVDYNMKQVEIMMIHRSELFNKDNLAKINLYNEYFGAGMSSIVFQELREAKALAYSVNSRYRIPDRTYKHHYDISYIGTQSDKLSEAMDGLTGLLNNMPLSDVSFNSAKDGAIKQMQAERYLNAAVLNLYLDNKKLGIDYDLRRNIYESYPGLSINDIKAFQEKYIKDKKFTYLVLGDKSKIDFSILEKYGKVEFLTLEQIFGY